jgi:hypothetical protein
MKTIKEIELEIIEIGKSMKDLDSKRAINTESRKIEILRQCKLYLETNPKPEFIEEMKSSVEFRIDLIRERYGAWCACRNLSQFKNPLHHYYNEMGMAQLKLQLKTLEYLIN